MKRFLMFVVGTCVALGGFVDSLVYVLRGSAENIESVMFTGGLAIVTGIVIACSTSGAPQAQQQ